MESQYRAVDTVPVGAGAGCALLIRIFRGSLELPTIKRSQAPPAATGELPTDLLNVPATSPASRSRPHKGMFVEHKNCGPPPSTLGAGLSDRRTAAKAVDQSIYVLAGTPPSLASQLLQGVRVRPGSVAGAFTLWLHYPAARGSRADHYGVTSLWPFDRPTVRDSNQAGLHCAACLARHRLPAAPRPVA